MINEQMQQLINYLIQIEYQSAYLNLSMSNYFNRLNLTGIGHWFRVQHDEERGHAFKAYRLLNRPQWSCRDQEYPRTAY